MNLLLVIDTSSALSTLALLDGSHAVAERVAESGRGFDVAATAEELLEGRARHLQGVAVALGPGSFTGLRSGISFGLGLARGLGVPIHGLKSLDLVAARGLDAATALSEAGRGRVYFLTPDGRTGIGEAGEVPRAWPLLGWTRPATAELLRGAGHIFLPEARTRSHAAAAAGLLEGSQGVAYDRVRAVYMSPFGGLSEGPA